MSRCIASIGGGGRALRKRECEGEEKDDDSES
jgi:hypothetical protein